MKAGRNASNPAHVVGLVRQPETVEVANWLIDKMGRGCLTAELLQPDELVSGIIAQARAPVPIGKAVQWASHASASVHWFTSLACRSLLPDDPAA